MRTLVELLREIEKAYDQAELDKRRQETVIFQWFERPGKFEVEKAERWLINQGVPEGKALNAVLEALKEGYREDLRWHEALQRVVNRKVRTNQVGWELYRGDWREFVREVLG